MRHPRLFLMTLALLAVPARADAPPPPSGGEPSATEVAPASEARGAPPIRVAVYQLEAEGIDDRVVKVFTLSLLEEVRKLQHLSAIGLDEVRAMLDIEAQKQLLGCEEDESCVAEIAGALGVDVVIVGTLARVGDESIVGLKRIEQREARVSQSFSQRLEPAGGEEFLAAVGPAVGQLFPERDLRDGLTRGVAAERALLLNPPPLAPWVFWTGVGTATVLAATTTVVAGAWLVAQSDYDAYVASGAATAIDGALLRDKGGVVVGTEAVAWALLGTTTAVALGTALLLPFTDWRGAGEEL